MTAPAEAAYDVQPAEPTPDALRAGRRSAWGMLALLAVLAVQAGLAVRLMRSNTAFLDEATYLGAGHQLIAAWLHGGPNLHYDAYFSGAPFLYPVLAASVDGLGGLAAVRSMSLLFMLLATVLVYASGRRLYGQLAGLVAAALFASVAGTQFLSAFATYDALALLLTAFALWLVLRATTPGDDSSTGGTTARVSPPSFAGVYLAAPVMVLADFTKYASVAFNPIIVGVALSLVASQSSWRQGLKVVGVLIALMVALMGLTFAVTGGDYLHAALSTTLARHPGTTAPQVVLGDAAEWVGAVAILALIAAAAMTFGAARGRTGWAHAGLAAVLASAAFVAPLNQARIETSTSLSKHVAFGALFGAILAGQLIARAVGSRKWTRLATPLAIVSLATLTVVGVHQSRQMFRQWPNSASFVAVLKPLVYETSRPMLVDDAQVPAYYLGGQVYPTRWYNTFYISFGRSASGRRVVGIPAYQRAIREGYFGLVALNFGSQRVVDRAVFAAIRANPNYHYLTKIQSQDVFGSATYSIWLYKGVH